MQSFIIRDETRRGNAVAFISAMKLTKPVLVEIRDYKRDRSAAQNRLMWKWYGIIGNDIGQRSDDLHEEMKVRVLGVEERMVGKQLLIMPKSTSKLSTKQMSEFLNAIEMLANELGITLPHPDDYAFALGRE